MSDKHSVTKQWIPRAKAGEQAAHEELYRRFVGRVVALARVRLTSLGIPTRVADAEDIANSVFARQLQGGFELIDEDCDSDGLWNYLAGVTYGKITDYARRQTAKKRGDGKVRGESAFITNNNESTANGIAHFARDNSFAEHLIHEELDHFLSLIGSGQHSTSDYRAVLTLRLQGHEIHDIAEQLGTYPRRVTRILAAIRQRIAEQSFGME